MKLWRQIRVWWKRRQAELKTPVGRLPVLLVRQDLETQVLPYEIDHRYFVIEYRTPECGVWLRLTRAYTATDNPRHWSLVHPWLFSDYESACVVAGTMTRKWVRQHLTQDRDAFNELKLKREEELRSRRVKKS